MRKKSYTSYVSLLMRELLSKSIIKSFQLSGHYR